MIEASEESGSPHLSAYVDHLTPRIGTPTLIGIPFLHLLLHNPFNGNILVCLDSGAGNYEQFWATTSLRGLMAANLTIKIVRAVLMPCFCSLIFRFLAS